jgi:hypothetical protein
MNRDTWRRILSPFVTMVAVVAVILDVTIWQWLTKFGRWLSHFAVFTWLERVVDRLSPNWVVAIFVAPFVPLIPLLKLGEFWLIAHHHYVWAALMIVGTKVVGAAFATRVFAIAKPKMLQVRWFARAYGWVVWLLDLGHRTLEAIPAWRAARDFIHRAVLPIRAGIARVWRWISG